MKKLILIVSLFLSLTVSAFALEKPIFLLLYSDTCPYCSNFISSTMQNSQIKNVLENYKVEMININKEKYVPYDIDYTGTVPSIHLLDSNHVQMANTLVGDIPAKDLLPALNQFLKLYYEFRKNVN